MFFVFMSSCKDQPTKSIDPDLLSGKWLIVNAKRNAKPTTTLNEAYFIFGEDNNMVTNFTGQDISASYQVISDIITHSGNGHDDQNYKILSLSRDSLILSTQIMKHDFEFFLLNERLDPFNNLEDEFDNIGKPVGKEDLES